jgi:vitamin B12 transporter
MPRMVYATLLAAALSGLLPGPLRAGEAARVVLPPVTVTGGLPAGCAARAVVSLGREELGRLPARTVAEALRFLPGVSLESRGLAPVQGDISLRGSTFSQVLVLIDGVRLSDPQTAHHNLDLPLALEEVERIEVLQGPSCARYGADAVAGAINIITRRPTANYLRLEGAGGSFATTRAALAAGGRTEKISGGLSLAREASEGYRFDTDYEIRTLSGRLASAGEVGADLFFGLQEKKFGAFDFYSPGLGFASREETGTRLVTAAVHSAPEGRLLEARAYFREHEDEFTLELRNPALFAAEHLTRVAGLQFFGQWEGWGLLSAGLELRGETIASNQLGDHERGVASPFAEYVLGVGPLDVDAAARLDLYSRFGPQLSPSLALLWRLWPEVSLRALVATAYRIPSFTELYYVSPANVGNAALEPEHSLSYGAGLLYASRVRPLEASLDFFERRESEIIDWVRQSASEPWRAVNSGQITVRGLEAQASYFVPWGSLRLDYVFVDKNLELEAALSKYVLTHPHHQLSLGLWSSAPFGLALFGGLTWRSYANQDYALLEAAVSKRLGAVELFAEGHNLLDARYSEALVPRPGIWGLGGLRLYLG